MSGVRQSGRRQAEQPVQQRRPGETSNLEATDEAAVCCNAGFGDGGVRMADAPKDQPPAVNWRFAVPIGLSIGLAIPTSQGVTHALEPNRRD